MPVGEDGTLVVEIPDWREDLVAIDDVRVSLDLWAGLAETLRSRGLADAHIGLIGRESLLHIAVDRIRDELPGLTLSWADDLIEDLRRYKSDSEIVLVREATRVGCEMVEAFVEAAVPGATEADCVRRRAGSRHPPGRLPARHPRRVRPERRPLPVGADAVVGRAAAAGAGRHDPPRHVRHRQRLLLRHGAHDRGRADRERRAARGAGGVGLGGRAHHRGDAPGRGVRRVCSTAARRG